jgi:polar amino acid transport system substrate-binding protein
MPTLFSALFLLCTLVSMGTLSSAVAAAELRFCYEDKQLRPYYFGDNNKIPLERPGATIEHLQLLTSLVPELTLKLERLPWKRCLAKLASGETDAIVGSYAKDREKIGRFPFDPSHKPDTSRAFAEHQTCLVTNKNANWSWDGKKFIGIDQVVIARPLGYAPLQSPEKQKIVMHYTLSGTMDLDLLERGRVNAVTTLCRIAGENAVTPYILDRDLKVLLPPLYSNTGYLIFSHQFYNANNMLAEQLWQQLAQNRGQAIYHSYLDLMFRLAPSPKKTTPIK